MSLPHPQLSLVQQSIHLPYTRPWETSVILAYSGHPSFLSPPHICLLRLSQAFVFLGRVLPCSQPMRVPSRSRAARDLGSVSPDLRPLPRGGLGRAPASSSPGSGHSATQLRDFGLNCLGIRSCLTRPECGTRAERGPACGWSPRGAGTTRGGWDLRARIAIYRRTRARVASQRCRRGTGRGRPGQRGSVARVPRGRVQPCSPR